MRLRKEREIAIYKHQRRIEHIGATALAARRKKSRKRDKLQKASRRKNRS
jgi:hypothetical protein